MRRCSDGRAGIAGVVLLSVGALVSAGAPAAEAVRQATPPGCAGTVYLTLDTGNMSQAEAIAAILQRHGVRATFFLANEKTPRGDYALDETWASYWRARAAEGHAFGSHTFDHVYFPGEVRAPDGTPRTLARPQFGPEAGRTLRWDATQVCAELRRVDARLREMAGRGLDPLWRAPGGRTNPFVTQAASACGYAHVHWAKAGFLGDELPSDRHPNDRLLAQALAGIRDGDILMAHLGIWSRQEPFAPMLDPLIQGLRQRGLCFATLREHPAYAGR